jgi:hypothetical protein
MNSLLRKILEHPFWGQVQDNDTAPREMSKRR